MGEGGAVGFWLGGCSRVTGRPAGAFLLGAWTGSFAKLDTIFGMYPACCGCFCCGCGCSPVRRAPCSSSATPREVYTQFRVRTPTRGSRTLHEVPYCEPTTRAARKLLPAEKAAKLLPCIDFASAAGSATTLFSLSHALSLPLSRSH